MGQRARAQFSPGKAPPPASCGQSQVVSPRSRPLAQLPSAASQPVLDLVRPAGGGGGRGEQSAGPTARPMASGAGRVSLRLHRAAAVVAESQVSRVRRGRLGAGSLCLPTCAVPASHEQPPDTRAVSGHLHLGRDCSDLCVSGVACWITDLQLALQSLTKTTIPSRSPPFKCDIWFGDKISLVSL